MNEYLLLKNCRLYNSINENLRTDVLIEGKKIISIGNINAPDGALIIDAEGKMITPGFIEVHLQGAGGYDVLDCSVEALEHISRTLASLGTTSYLGTTVVKPQTDNKHLRVSREYVNKNMGGATLLGFHLEGPFINVKKKGGLDPASIYAPAMEAMDKIYDLLGNTLSMMTIAPELPGNLEIIEALVKHGTVASFAHSDATYEEAKLGFQAGINHVTHLFNAMPPLGNRIPGPLAAIFENNLISAQIISDGHHLHPAVVNMAYKLLGPERCICITDGIQAMGLPEGNYLYNGREYISKDGVARYLDGTLIGSATSLGNIAFKFMEFTKCSLEDAINSVTINPARLLGIDNRKGSIETGKDADIVILNDDHSVFLTIINGQIVFQQAEVV